METSVPAVVAHAKDADALFGASGGVLRSIGTPAVIAAMLESGPGISDLIFSPGRPPQVEKHGELTAVDDRRRCPMLQAGRHGARRARPDRRQRARAADAEGTRARATSRTRCPRRARFRVNVFRQRGTFAIVMRVIATKIPTLAELNLPASL